MIFTLGNSALHGLVPLSNKFVIKFRQKCVCPLSPVREVFINGEMKFSSSLSCFDLFLGFIAVKL